MKINRRKIVFIAGIIVLIGAFILSINSHYPLPLQLGEEFLTNEEMRQIKAGQICGERSCITQECGINSVCDISLGASCIPGENCVGNWAEIEYKPSCIGPSGSGEKCTPGELTDCGWITKCQCIKVGLIYACYRGDGWWSEYYLPCL